jgi:hypothetical protein
MDDDLLRIARRVFERAQKRGLDHLAMTETAVREIQIVRPDVTAAEALTALNVVSRS